MLTFRRALVVAAVLLTLFLLLRNNHPSRIAVSAKRKSPKPTGTYHDNKVLLDSLKEQLSKISPDKPSTTSTSALQGDSNDRVALAKKPIPQIPLSDLKAQPLRKQLAYAFPYDPSSRFPAYIWQTWKSTPASADFGDDFRVSEASWTALHPNFVHDVVTDAVAVHLIRHFYASIPEIVQAYEALPEAVLKADFFRYLLLLARGGIYSDIDTTALKSAVDWIPPEVPRNTYGLVVGIEADPDRPDWKDWYSRRIQFCQWTIQAKPGHPVLVEIVAAIAEETLRMKAADELDKKHMKSVVEFTGPAIWTDMIFRYFNNPEYFDMSTSKGNISWERFTGITTMKRVGDVIVLPITSFSPGVGQMGAMDEDDPMAFVKHAFEGTWKPESERHIGSD